MTTTKITLKQIKIDGGATLNANGAAVTYKTGYQVSKRDVYTIPVYRLKWSLIRELYSKGEFVGIWIENGIAYVDISEHINGKANAKNIGKSRNQISVWDWAKSTAVYC